MSFLQYRRFTFFDKVELKKNGNENPFEEIKDLQWTCNSSGKGAIIFGNSEGMVYSCNRQLKISAFKAYELRVDHIYHMKQHNVLVTIGEDEVANNFLLKVWNLDKVDRTLTPMCTRIVRLAPNNKTSKVTCLVVHENMNYMAVGFENGCVLLFIGDVMKETHSKRRMVFEGQHKVTNLVFRSFNKQHVLFITTETETISINLVNKDVYQKNVLDTHGCDEKCSVLTDQSQDLQLVIARTNGIFFYQPDCEGPCLGFEGEKTQIHWFRSYLVVVSKEPENINRNPDQSEMSILTVYDVRNKFIAYSCPLPKVFGVFCEWGSLYVVCWDYKIYHLQEMDVQSKLDLLFKKNLYDLALQLAEQLEQGDLADIHKSYGDHLYSKGDYKESIIQYIKTIGRLEPSYVIMKFLDPSQIQHLMTYLEHLYERGLTTDDHVTLLLNCYTKLKNETKLNHFIQTGNLGYDVETTIKLCRLAGYFEQALQLAISNGRHDYALKIILDDVKDHDKAIEYISGLDFEKAETYMKKFGKELMDVEPDKTTELVKRLCTDVAQHSEEGSLRKVQRSNADEFIHIFANDSPKLIEFLEHILQVQSDSGSSLHNTLYTTLVELHLLDHLHEHDDKLKEIKKQKIFNLLKKPEACYSVTHILKVFEVNIFKEGMMFLYEKSKMYEKMLLLHMHSDSYTDVIETCKRYGTSETDLWVQSLSYFARKENCKQEIIECLDYIEKHNLLSPLLVIQTLSLDSTCTLEVVKDYLIRCLRRDKEEIEENEREMERVQEDTERKRTEMLQAETQLVIFQNHKCSLCSHLLDLPSVHFFCKHSFHQHCFDSYSENAKECPVCLPEKKKLLERLRVQEEGADLQESFTRSLTLNAKNRFSVVAEYFGKGLFVSGNKTQ